ncbi:MAG: hypothetical protein IKY10_00560, partial [Clostridia bacterium]|nr:hypothetical protein [Clostridia bacterium]
MGNVVSGITVYIYDSPKFINNSAYEKGGAVYARTLRIPGSPLFEGNYVQSGNGGAVYATDAYIYGNPVFKDNVAINGSAIYVSYYLFLGKNDIENADFGETFPDAVVTLENNHGEELSYSEASGQIAFGYIFYLYGSIQNESTMSIDYAHPNIYLGEDQYVSCNHHEINQNGNMISVYKAGVKTDGVLDVCNIIYADNNGIPEPDREIFQVVNVSYSQYEVKHYGYDGGYVQPRETSIAKEFTFYNTSATVYPGETAYFYFYAPHRFGTVWAMYDQGNAYIYQLVEVTRGEDGYGRFGMCFGESGTYSFYFDCEGDYINEQYPTPTKTGWVEMTVLPQPLLTFENEKIELKDYSSGDEGERTITQNISIDSSLNFGYLKFTSGNTNIVTVPQEKVAVASDYKLEMTIKKEGGTQITVEYFKSQNDQTPLATKTFTVYAGEMSVDIKVKSNKFTVDGWMTTGDNVNVEITLTPGEHNRDLSFAVNAEGAYMGIHSEGVLWDQSYANGVIFEPQRGRGEYVIKFWAWESGAGVEYEDGTYVVNVVNPLIYKEYVVHVVDYVAPIPTNSTTPMIFNGDYDRPCPGNWNSHINAGDTSGMFDCWLDYNYHAGTHTAYVEGLPWNEDYDHMWAWEDGTHENKPWTYTILPKKLTTPTGIGFYDSMISFASINEDPYYFQYKINLYKDNALYRTIMHDVEDCPLMFDIPITITGAGA